MKADPVLEELWRIKDKLSREMAANPGAYFTKLDEIAKAEEKAERKVIRSAREMRRFAAEAEVLRSEAPATVLNDKSRGQA